MTRSELISEIAEDLAAFKRVMMTSRAKHPMKDMPTPAQIGVLVFIAQEGTQNLKDLAKCLCMSSSAATQLIDALVHDKLLTRTEDKDDRRRVQLALTALGKKKLIVAKKWHLEMFTKLVEPLTEEELKEWKSLQRKMIEHAL